VALSANRTVTAIFGRSSSGPLALGKLIVKGSSATLKAVVPGPGTVSISGKGLRSAALAAGAGEVTLHMGLSRDGKQALETAKRGKLKVRVTIAFISEGSGASVAATRVVTFERKRRDH
jgi:hypothetical protein